MWSEEEIQFLLDNPTMSLFNLAKTLGKSEDAVRSKRSRLKIRSGVVPSLWTAEERYILQMNYEDLNKSELMKLLPNRTWDSIRAQVAYLRKRGWNI